MSRVCCSLWHVVNIAKSPFADPVPMIFPPKLPADDLTAGLKHDQPAKSSSFRAEARLKRMMTCDIKDQDCVAVWDQQEELIPSQCYKLHNALEYAHFEGLLKAGQVDLSDDHEILPSHLHLESHQNLRRFQLKAVSQCWVQCCNPKCGRFSVIANNGDPSLVPKRWVCSMTLPKLRRPLKWKLDSDHIPVEYVPGSLVWVKGPLWPGMVDFCPDTEEYYWQDDGERTPPTHYHVIFLLPKVSRQWVEIQRLIPLNDRNPPQGKRELKSAFRGTQLLSKMSLKQRLLNYSFLKLYQGKWGNYETEQRKKTRSGRKSSSSSSSSEPNTDEDSTTKVIPNLANGLERDLQFSVPLDLKNAKSMVERAETENPTCAKPKNPKRKSEADERLVLETEISQFKAKCFRPDESTNGNLDVDSAFEVILQESDVTEVNFHPPNSPGVLDLKGTTPKLEVTKMETDTCVKPTSTQRPDKAAGGLLLETKISQFKAKFFQFDAVTEVKVDNAEEKLTLVKAKPIEAPSPVPVSIESMISPEEPHAYPKPPLQARFLIILAVQNTLLRGMIKVEFEHVLWFLCTQFPYFETREALARSLLEKVVGVSQRVEVRALSSESLEQNMEPLLFEVEQNKSGLLDSMKFPCLLEAFIGNCYAPSLYGPGPLDDKDLMMIVYWSIHTQVYGFNDDKSSRCDLDLVFRFMFPFFFWSSKNYVKPILLQGFEPSKSCLKKTLVAVDEMPWKTVVGFSPCVGYLKKIARDFTRSLDQRILK